MSFIDAPMDDVTEPSFGPKGLYTFVVEKADDKMDGTFRKGMLLICKIEKAPAGVNPEELKNIMHNISFPLPTDDEAKAKIKLQFLKRVALLFKVDTKGRKCSEIKCTEFIGKRVVNGGLDTKIYDGDTSNILVLPHLPQVRK